MRAFLEEAAPASVLLSRFRQIAVQLVPSRGEALPGARETLAQVASLGIPCAILTNGWSSIEQRKARHLGFQGQVLVSEDTGRRKPERAAFELLSAALALPPDRIWYVGDDPLADVAESITQRLAGFALALRGLVHAPCSEGVFRTLEQIARQHGVGVADGTLLDLALTPDDIAALTGSSSETVALAFFFLEREGRIRTDGSLITLLGKR